MIGSNATVVRVRGLSTDEYGDPTGTETRTTIEGCAFAPRTSGDVADRGRDGVIVGLTLYAPFGTDLLHTDKVEIDGVLYEADGEAGSWKHPITRWEAGIELALKRAAG